MPSAISTAFGTPSPSASSSAVLDAVVEAVLGVRRRAQAELHLVAQPIAVGIGLGVVDADREALGALVVVRDAVVIGVGGVIEATGAELGGGPRAAAHPVEAGARTAHRAAGGGATGRSRRCRCRRGRCRRPCPPATLVAVSRAMAPAGPETVRRCAERVEAESPAPPPGAAGPLGEEKVMEPPSEPDTAFGQSFQPTSGTAMAPTPSTPAQRPAATVPANLRSRPAVEERLWLSRFVMSESIRTP